MYTWDDTDRGEWWYELFDYGLDRCEGVRWDIEKAKRIIEEGLPDRIAAKMMLSVCENADDDTNSKVMQFLIDSGAVDVNAPVYDGRIPIMMVGGFFPRGGLDIDNVMKTIHILLDAGADMHDDTLIHCAYNCYFDADVLRVFKFLLESNVDVNVRDGKHDLVEALYARYNRGYLPSTENVRKGYVNAIFQRENFRMRNVKSGTLMHQDLELLFDPQPAVILKRWLMKDKRFESEELIKEICSFVCYNCLIDAWTISRKRKHSKNVKTRKKKKR